MGLQGLEFLGGVLVGFGGVEGSETFVGLAAIWGCRAECIPIGSIVVPFGGLPYIIGFYL